MTDKDLQALQEAITNVRYQASQVQNNMKDLGISIEELKQAMRVFEDSN